MRFTLAQLFVLTVVAALLVAVRIWPNRDTRQDLANRRLLVAAERGELEAAQRALEAGADRWHLPIALNLAVEADHRSVARLLLERGADPDTERTTGTISGSFHSQARFCVEAGNADMLRLLLEHGASAVSSDLLAAVDAAHPPKLEARLVRLLIDHGADVQDALETVSFRNDISVAEKLIRYGATRTPPIATRLGMLDELARFVAADPSLLGARFPDQRANGQIGETTLLAIALDRGDREMARFLFDQGAPLEVRVFGGETLLHAAVIGGDAELVRWLLEQGLDVNARSEGERLTPLFLAVRQGEPQIAAVLIEYGAELEARNVLGTTPLIEAIARRNERLAVLLLKAGASPRLNGPDGKRHDWVGRQQHASFLRDVLQQIDDDSDRGAL